MRIKKNETKRCLRLLKYQVVVKYQVVEVSFSFIMANRLLIDPKLLQAIYSCRLTGSITKTNPAPLHNFFLSIKDAKSAERLADHVAIAAGRWQYLEFDQRPIDQTGELVPVTIPGNDARGPTMILSDAVKLVKSPPSGGFRCGDEHHVKPIMYLAPLISGGYELVGTN